MKFKNVEVGQRVVVKRSTNGTWDRTKFHIGEEFEVIFREGPDYPEDGGTVCVRKCGDAGVSLWCNHKDLGRVKADAGTKKPLKVGDKVIVKVQPRGYMFPVGTEGVVTAVDDDAPEYKVEALGDHWFYTSDQLKRVKEKAPAQKPAPATKRDIKAELAAAWPWPEGTPVRFAESGDYPQHADKGGCVLGDDGTLPPVLDAYGKLLYYVDANDVLLDTEYNSWDRHSSREVSALTEEQRTGPLYKEGADARIKHSRDGDRAPQTYFYYAGDYRDNGDGTGTVLTLEEIFLNGLKK